MKTLMFMSLLMVSCALREEIVKENVRIHIATEAMGAVNPDSVYGSIIQTGESGNWIIEAPCDTIEKECLVVLDDVTNDNVILNLTFFKEQKEVATLSSNGMDIGGDQISLSFSVGEAKYTLEGYAVIRKALQCKTGSSNCFTDVRQGGRNYRTVTVGNQTWMVS